MSGVSITNLSKSFSSKSVALQEVSLDVPDGEMLVLLGPSGCGKTTILRCLAGLERPTDGTVSIGGRTVFESKSRTDVIPDRRNIGMVFQNYGLWPHLTVLENIRFPLRARRNKEGLDQRWAEEMAEMVSCSHLLDRHPGELSGGQQQRIALARALVARPALLLFDEPLSNLDARLRADLRNAIRELHKTFQFTGVYVTHDQAEGLTVGDRIAVMNAGQVVQVGAPADVHRDPATEWAADFMGMTNRLGVGDPKLEAAAIPSHESATIRFRPVDAVLRTAGSTASDSSSVIVRSAAVTDRAFSGNSTEFMLQTGGSTVAVKLDSRDAVGLPDAGGLVDIVLAVPDIRFFDTAGDVVRALEPA